MKVRLKANEAKKESIRGWLREGQEYTVLSVEVMGAEKSAYRIATSDNDTPALFEVIAFDITDNRLPASWVAVQVEGLEVIQMMPIAWSENGFWEAYFDGDNAARKQYHADLMVLQEHTKE
jgi:hypothetical protein